MAEKIKRTHAERDALLSKVFDSTLQTKDIEITEAGTTEITPDEGFFALKKVNLNVNVQGGGSGDIEYLDLSGMPGAGELGVMASLVKLKKGDGSFAIAPPMQVLLTNGSIDTNQMLNVVAMAVNPNAEVFINGANATIDALVGGMLAQFPRLTKEEFYAL